MKLSELGKLLDYDDVRSAINWCKRNKILVVQMGKARYVATIQVELFFETEFKKFTKKHFENPDEIMAAYKSDDKVSLSQNMKAPMEKKAKKEFIARNERSNAAKDFLNKLKSA